MFSKGKYREWLLSNDLIEWLSIVIHDKNICIEILRDLHESLDKDDTQDVSIVPLEYLPGIKTCAVGVDITTLTCWFTAAIAGSDGRILLIDDDCPTTFEQWKNSK